MGGREKIEKKDRGRENTEQVSIGDRSTVMRTASP